MQYLQKSTFVHPTIEVDVCLPYLLARKVNVRTLTLVDHPLLTRAHKADILCHHGPQERMHYGGSRRE